MPKRIISKIKQIIQNARKNKIVVSCSVQIEPKEIEVINPVVDLTDGFAPDENESQKKNQEEND